MRTQLWSSVGDRYNPNKSAIKHPKTHSKCQHQMHIFQAIFEPARATERQRWREKRAFNCFCCAVQRSTMSYTHIRYNGKRDVWRCARNAQQPRNPDESNATMVFNGLISSQNIHSRTHKSEKQTLRSDSSIV